MKKILVKIIIYFFCIIFISACHTLEHNDFASKPMNKIITSKKGIDNIVDKNKKNLMPKEEDISNEKSDETQNIIKKTIVKLPINKSKKIKMESFNPNIILNLPEKKLFEKMGKSDFVKHEGKLKNHQYYLSKCFLDVFVIKKGNTYYVDFVQSRPIKLSGKLNKEECLQDINKKISILEK